MKHLKKTLAIISFFTILGVSNPVIAQTDNNPTTTTATTDDNDDDDDMGKWGLAGLLGLLGLLGLRRKDDDRDRNRTNVNR